ncbi:prolyl oligopeptidase family serine peptidase [Microbacterium sp. 1P10UB]|uniref:prolyl oligopeptidase family serine peptidase n=1 Tax=unclassified Microbacterium TaxID=2609290 RepID=UPI0039A27626
MTQTLPYGSWPSPLSARDVAAGSRPVDAGRYVGDDIWWLERLPAENGRSAVRRLTADAAARGDEPETVLPAPWDVRSRVHEYGGAAWTTDATGSLFFVHGGDQRVWRGGVGVEPVPLTPEDPRARYADLVLAAGRLLAVREVHAGAPVPRRDIVAIPLDGSGGTDPARLTSVVAGSDFLAAPRVSPDGRRLAWIAWDHPDMPWDASELRVGDLDALGSVESWRTLAGGPGVSVLQPEWVSDREILHSSDRTGRWNLDRTDLDGRSVAVAPADADTGGPLWNLGARWFAPLADGRVLAVRTDGADVLVVIDGDDLRGLPADASSRLLLGDVRGTRVLFSGSGSSTLGGLWEVDLDDAAPVPRLVRGTVDESPDAAWLPVAQELTFDGAHGPVHAFAYPPTNPDAAAPDGELPPYLLLAHGGPTAHASGGAAMDVAFFTSRGIGVLDVNYGGSTGYGRAYRERLRGQWGVVDRDDMIAAAAGIAAAGVADADRLAIRGGSAGGWTVLCALTAGDVFAAGISRYGVADLRALAADTHDFEARYLDGLVGPYPEAEAVYVERSPLTHLDRFTTPMLIEQGTEDPVVPPAQSEAVRDALAARGVAHAYLAFEGESHGFRRAETIVASLEAELSFLGQVLDFSPAGAPVLPLEGELRDR